MKVLMACAGKYGEIIQAFTSKLFMCQPGCYWLSKKGSFVPVIGILKQMIENMSPLLKIRIKIGLYLQVQAW